jgi:mannosyltransferase OCH1-like enzyme
MSIPKIFHQIWIGTNGQHPHFVRWREHWKLLHPDWTFKLWTTGPEGINGALLACGNELFSSRYQNLLVRAANLAQRANIWRQEILLGQGGVYLDTDIEPFKNIDHLLAGHDAVASRMFLDEPDGTVRHSSAFLAASAGHPWIHDAVESLPENPPEVPLSMGDSHITRMVRRHPEIHILKREEIMFKNGPPKTGNKQFWKTLGSNVTPFPETCAIHRWSSQWYPTGFSPTQPAP